MNELVLFILVYFAADASPSPQPSARLSTADPKRNLTASEIRMNPDGAIQYLKFHDVSYNLTDFTICTWIKLSNFSHTQTIFRLTGNKKETVMSWQVDAHPTETMRVTIKNRLVASETTRLAAGGRWNHVCFQWKDSTGVWAIFVNAKIHSVGQTPAADNNTAASSGLHGKGAGIVGDDGAPCRNGWRVYGLYMTGPAACCTANAKTKKNDKRQAVYESDSDDPAGGAAVPKPFQWFSRTFAFVKRAFTFVIIPFFKFVRNTFFQTRSMDDTVVDVSETHLTVSDVKFVPPAATTPMTTTPMTTTTTTTTTMTTATTAANTTVAESVDDAEEDDRGAAEEDDRGAVERRRSSKRETTGKGERCAVTGRGRTDGRVAVSDLLPADVPALTPDAARYLRTVSEGLNVVGVNAAFVRRTFACCRPSKLERPVAVDWDNGRYTAHDVIASPHVCGSG